MKVILFIPIVAKPWQAPVVTSRGAFSPNNDFKKKVKAMVAGSYEGKPYDKYVAVLFGFYMPIPKSATREQRKKMLERKILPIKGDCTNFQKLFEDCLNKVVITDDKNVGSITSYKCYSEEPGVLIMVQDYEGYFQEHSNSLEACTHEEQEEGK